MLKRYEVAVTYEVYAQDEDTATGKVFENTVAPATVDVYELPTRRHIDIEIDPF